MLRNIEAEHATELQRVDHLLDKRQGRSGPQENGRPLPDARYLDNPYESVSPQAALPKVISTDWPMLAR